LSNVRIAIVIINLFQYCRQILKRMVNVPNKQTRGNFTDLPP